VSRDAWLPDPLLGKADQSVAVWPTAPVSVVASARHHNGFDDAMPAGRI